MARHLVTGGAGFIGSALANHLAVEGHEVVVFDRFSRGKSERLLGEVEQIQGDVCWFNAVQQVVAEVDCVWHLAYVQGTQTFYANPKDVIRVALDGVMNVLTACEGDPGKDLILVSSSEVYQNPPEGMFPTDETVPLSVPDVLNPRYSYGAGKIASEVATFAYKDVLSRALIVRPHNIYGPDMGEDHVIPQFARRMQNLEMFPGGEDGLFHIQGSGHETRSFCYITDCVDGLMTVYEKGETGVYHLGNPSEEVSIRDLAQMVAWLVLDKKIKVVPGELPKGSPTRRLPAIRKLVKLGYEPKVSLHDGLKSTLAWYSQVPA